MLSTFTLQLFMSCRMCCPQCADRLLVEHNELFVVRDERWLSASTGSPEVRGRDLASVLFFWTDRAKMEGNTATIIQIIVWRFQ